MKEPVFCFLSALVEYGGVASVPEISAASGYETSRFYQLERSMLADGLMHKPWNGLRKITERGKIALAIEVGRRTRRRLTIPQKCHTTPR